VKIGLVTTTINVPRVLGLYRRLDPSVEFFVAGDNKTPVAAQEFCAQLGNCRFYSLQDQLDFGYACSELIGWNTCGRRNIAFLEALKWGADVVVTVNDDDIPMNAQYFSDFLFALDSENRPLFTRNALYCGIEVSSPSRWFDPGSLLVPPARHRGFPFEMPSSFVAKPVVDARVGVAVGLCLGDPDVDATTRIERPGLRVHSTSKLLDAGVVVAPSTRTVFNSENTALLREFLPAFFHMPGVGRSDDILASLVVQRVMRDRGYRVHFGQPYVWQQRNPHRLLDDLRVEIFGMERTVEFAKFLDSVPLGSSESVLQQVYALYKEMERLKWLPEIAWKAGLAFCDDCERVL
jgi:hypothetical protein